MLLEVYATCHQVASIHGNSKQEKSPRQPMGGACVNTPPQGGAREPSRIPADGTLFTREDPGWLVKLLETRRSPSSFLELARKGLHRAAAI